MLSQLASRSVAPILSYDKDPHGTELASPQDLGEEALEPDGRGEGENECEQR